MYVFIQYFIYMPSNQISKALQIHFVHYILAVSIINSKNMGNQIEQKSLPSDQLTKQQLQVLYQCQQGQVVQSKSDSREYFIRQLSFSNEQSLRKILKELQNYKENLNNDMLTHFINIQQQCVKNMCGSLNRLRVIFQFSSLSINDQVQGRKLNNNYFDILDCYRIIIGCIKGIIQVQKQCKQYSVLIQNQIINRVFVHPQRILLMPGGLIKLCSPLIVSPYDRFQHKHSCYYSPEKLADFDYGQDEKSAIFQLGITLLHVFTLKDCKDIYNGFEVRQDLIDNKIIQIWQIYSDSLICEILAKMTQTFRSNRINLDQCIYLMELVQQKLKEKEKEMEKLIFNLKQKENYMEMEGEIQSESEREINMEDRNKSSNRLMSGHNNHSNYYISTYTSRDRGGYTRRSHISELNLNSKRQSKFESYCQEELISTNSFHTDQPQFYGNFGLKNREKSVRESRKKHIQDQDENKQNRIKSSNLCHSKSYNGYSESLQIYEQTNSKLDIKEVDINLQSYMSNHELFNPQKQSLKSLFNKNMRNMKGKQSYQYGNQLTQGIISTNSMNNFKSANLVPQSCKNTVSNTSKFEWKRTQFNKNRKKNSICNVQHKLDTQLSPFSEQNYNKTDRMISKFMEMSIEEIYSPKQ